MNLLETGLQYFCKKISPPVKYHGLMNQGATCYLNSVLQVLFMNEDFRAAVERHTCEKPDTECIDRHLKTLFDDLKERTAYTYKITNKLGIDRVYEQRDAAEYFEKILNLTSPEASEIFHGQLTNMTKCSTCGTETGSAGPFWHLPLALVDSYSECYSVLDGIEEYFRASEFSGENQMYCDQCDDKSDATTKCVIKHHPDVLMLLLKRFEFDYRYMTYIKINRTVNVPCTLQIPEKQTYELYAVVDHFGDLRSGHYTATIKDDERWYKFDDTTVMLLDYQPFHVDNFEKSCSAYLLFYRRNERAADTCPQDFRETPAGFIPATSDTCDQHKDVSLTEEVEGTVEVGEETVVTVSIDTNEETGTKVRVGSRRVGLLPDLSSNVEDQDKGVYTTEIKPYSHQERNDLSFPQDAHAETQRDEGKKDNTEDMGGDAEAAKIETFSGETLLEDSVEVQNSDNGRQRTPEISQDFKPDVSDRYAVHVNKQDETRGAESRVMDVKTDEDGKERKGESLPKYSKDTEGLEDVREDISEDLGAAQEVGHDLKSVDKQRDEERKERDAKADDKIEISNSQQEMPKDDQGGSRSYKIHEQLREEKRDVKGDVEQKRGDDKHAQRREMSGRQQDFGQGRSDDVRQSRSEQKISVSHARHKDVGEERQNREHKIKGENRMNSSLRRGKKKRQMDSEFNEDRVKRRRGSEKSTPPYDEIKDGIQRTSRDSMKSCVENSEGNARRKYKTDTNVSLLEHVHNLTLSETETNSTIPPQKQKVSDTQEQADGREHGKMEKRVEKKGKLPRIFPSKKQQRKKKEKKQNKSVSCFSIFCKSQRNADQTSESD